MKSKQAPNAAVILILVGGLLVSFSGALAIAGIPTGFTFAYGHLMIRPLQGISIYHGIIELLSGIILVVAAFYIKYKGATAAQNLSVVALIFSIVSLVGGGGFFIGFILAAIGSVIGIASGYSAMERHAYVRPSKVRRAGSKPITRAAPNARALNTLTVDEKKLYSMVEEADGAIFQAELVEKSRFSKVKVSRILDRLEGRGLIDRRRRGMTNIVIIHRGTD